MVRFRGTVVDRAGVVDVVTGEVIDEDLIPVAGFDFVTLDGSPLVFSSDIFLTTLSVIDSRTGEIVAVRFMEQGRFFLLLPKK